MRSIIFLLFTLIISLAGCSKVDDSSEQVSSIFFLNGYPSTASISYYFGNQLFLTSQYQNANFYNIPSGNNRLTIRSNTQSILADSVINFKQFQHYSSLLYGASSAPQFVVFEDGFVSLGTSNTAIRFFNLANDTTLVNFFIDTEKIASFSNRSTEDKASLHQNKTYQIVNSNTVNIYIKDNEGNALDSIKNDRLQGGFHYTYALVGGKDDRNQPIKLIRFRL